MSVDLKLLSPANLAWLERFLQDVSVSDVTPPDPAFVEVFAEGDAATGSRLIVLLPGSYIKVKYMTEFARSISQKLPAARVIGINYPSRCDEYSVEQINQFRVVDYVRWVTQHLVQTAGYRVTLIGHSLGTIVTQMTLLTYLHQSPTAYKIDSAVVLGGGAPKLTWRDYLETLPRLEAIWLSMRMLRNPKAFAFSKAMARALNGEQRWRDLMDQHLIYPESKTIMQETFIDSNYAYIPRSLLDAQGIKMLVIGGDRDVFIPKGTILRGMAQWGGDHRILPLEHTDLVMGKTGVEVGGMIGDWIAALKANH